MNRDCAEGLRLRRRFEQELKKWGWFDAFTKAVELMHVGPAQVHEFQVHASKAQSKLLNARFAYSDHIARCVKCSRRLITPDAIPAIQERLENDSASP
jgi:hypothetical protein